MRLEVAFWIFFQLIQFILSVVPESDHCSIKIIDHDQAESSLLYHTEVKYLESAEWSVYFNSNVPIDTTWMGPNKKRLHNSGKYTITTNDNRGKTTLVTNNVDVNDVGEYCVRIQSTENEACHDVLTFTLHMQPVVRMPSSFVVKKGDAALVKCTAVGVTMPNFSWKWSLCSLYYPEHSMDIKYPWIDRMDKRLAVNNMISSYYTKNVSEWTDVMKLNPVLHGLLTCEVYNEPFQSISVGTTFVYVLRSPELVAIDQNPELWVLGVSAQLVCSVQTNNHTKVLWTHNGHLVTDSASIRIERGLVNASTYQVRLLFNSIELQHHGSYGCHALPKQSLWGHMGWGDVNVQSVRVFTPAKEARVVRRIRRNETLQLYCTYNRISEQPTWQWFKDGKLLPNTNEQNYDGRYIYSVALREPTIDLMLRVMEAEDGDAGQYLCSIFDEYGTLSEQWYSVHILEEASSTPARFDIGMVCGSLVLLLLSICVGYFVYRREHEQRIRLKRLGIAYFDTGNMLDFDPKRSRTEQADLLPYDMRFEFPRDRLCLSGVRLGHGAFGVVFKALALNIQPGVAETTVAVKTIERDRDEDLKALIAELKILIYLGNGHVNVVRLLGAVTRDIRKRSLFVILEFCALGNLRDFLTEHRQSFVNQVDRKRDLVILTEQLDSNALSTVANIPTNTDTDRDNVTVARSTDCIGIRTKSDYIDGNIDTITTTDLVSWSYQVARGMSYLAASGVLHGDLAARNILLCPDKIVKICDFGLSRSVKPETDYKKESEGKLPLKWLAIESISHRIFNASTDVWSFGVFMWELFSMAQTPYADVPAEGFLARLEAGHRLVQPPYATRRLFDMMSECWLIDTTQRPLFRALEQRLAEMLPADLLHALTDQSNQYLQLIDDEYGDSMEPIETTPSQRTTAECSGESSKGIELLPIQS